MANNKKHLLHVRSNETTPKEYGGVQIPYPKLPSVAVNNGVVDSPIKKGEIAVNYGEGVESLSILNSNDKIVRFGPESELEEVSIVLSGALSDLEESLDGVVSDVEQLKYDIEHITFDVDDDLDDESENPVQNKVITERISEMDLVNSAAFNDLELRKLNKSDVDNELDAMSDNPIMNSVVAEKFSEIELVTSEALNDLNDRLNDVSADVSSVEEALDGKQDALTFDSAPTSGSTNPVTSGGVWDEVATKLYAYYDEGASIYKLTDDSPTFDDVQSAILEGKESFLLRIEVAPETAKMRGPSFLYFTESSRSTIVFDGITANRSFVRASIAMNGVLTLTEYKKADLVGGKVPASQLPSYVDDVIEGVMDGDVFIPTDHDADVQASGKIYVDTVTNKAYRWSGSAYVEVSPTPSVDPAPIQGSDNLVTSGGVYSAIEGAKTQVDDDLYLDSENPVQNKVVTERISEMDDVYSAAINDLNSSKQDALVSGESIKTVNGISLLGSGNIDADNIFRLSPADFALVEKSINGTISSQERVLFGELCESMIYAIYCGKALLVEENHSSTTQPVCHISVQTSCSQSVAPSIDGRNFDFSILYSNEYTIQPVKTVYIANIRCTYASERIGWRASQKTHTLSPVDSVSENDEHPVTSGAVYNAIEERCGAIEEDGVVLAAAINSANEANANTNIEVTELRTEVAQLRAIIEDLVTSNNLTSNLL